MSGGNWKEMFDAAVAGDLGLVEFHVKAGVDVDYAHPEFLSTPLVASILAGQEGVARYLLDSGAKPTLRSEFDGLTPVEAARQAGLAALEARLVELGATPPAPTQARRGWLTRLFSRSVSNSAPACGAPAPGYRPPSRPPSMQAVIPADSVVEFLHRFEELAGHEDFSLIEEMIDEQAFFRFNDGDFIGRAAIQGAFEKSWRGDPTVKKARFYLSDIRVLSTDRSTATATYTYHWEGSQGEQQFKIRGRGTRVLVRENGRWRIVHEHLSRFPK